MHRIDGPGATVDKKFTEGDPVGGTAATVVTAAWMNDVQEELVSVLAAAGITPVKGTQDQLLKAIRSISTGVVGASASAKMAINVASASATFTADEVLVKSALGNTAWVLPGFNRTINLAATGAGGMDTGTAPVNGYVALYAIYNPANGATALLAVNATSIAAPPVYGGANMPAGYTASALVSVWGTNASGQFQVGYQVDREVHTLPFAILASSVATLPVTSISIASAVPLNAKKGFFKTSMSQGSGGNVGFVIQPHASQLIHVLTISTTIALSQSTIVETLPILTPQLFYFSTQTSNAGNYNMFLSGYIF